jgi:hypothetical protein
VRRHRHGLAKNACGDEGRLSARVESAGAESVGKTSAFYSSNPFAKTVSVSEPGLTSANAEY